MNTRIDRRKLICATAAAGLLAGCASMTPPPLPPGNPADATVHVPMQAPPNLLAHDETTVAIQSDLSQTATTAKSAQSMQPMDHGNMPGMQHGEMKMEDHQAKATEAGPEKKALADQMKKTSEEMKTTSEEMKEKSETNSQAFYYTCPIHPQIHADKPGKCPICGMTLIRKEGAPSK